MPSGSRLASGPTTRRARRLSDRVCMVRGGNGGEADIPGTDPIRSGIESRRRSSKSISKTLRRAVAKPSSSTRTDHPRFPLAPVGNPASPKFSDPIQAARASTMAYFAWRNRYRLTTSDPPLSHRTSTPAPARSRVILSSSGSIPPTGPPSKSTRTRIPRRTASSKTPANRPLVNVYTPNSIVLCADPRKRRRGPSPSSGERTAVTVPCRSKDSRSNADCPTR